MAYAISWIILGLQLFSVGLAGAQPAASPMKLAAVEVTGMRRYTPADVVKLSGLEPGASVAPADFDAATQRLAGTGLFKEVAYRYATAAGRTTVTFAIEEAEWTIPVIFDNFVWLEDEEIVQALRQRIPSFDGTAPTLAGVPELFTRQLQALLQTKQIAGSIEFTPQASLQTGIIGYIFKVKDPAPKVCALRFTGASAIKEADLVGKLAIVGSDYSRSFTESSARGTLTDLYRQRGHWRATLGKPAAVLEQGQACSGVSVTISVDEGSPYVTERFAWSGNTSMPSKDLDGLMPLKSGDLAGVEKLDDGLRRVQTAYGKQGYIQHRSSYEPRLDDQGRKTTFDVKIEEGPQFRFGTVTFSGLPPDGVALLTKLWQLKAGEVFDASYPTQFLFDNVMPRLRQGAASPRIQQQMDEPNRIVNVSYAFGS